MLQLDKVIPFGRSLQEYTLMFNLTEQDKQKKILSVADGPACFNAEMYKAGYATVTSIDPVYAFSAEEIKQQFYVVVDNVIEQVRNTSEDWVWTYHRSPDDLKKNRIYALDNFLADYETGKQIGRYLCDELPNLKFADNQFELVLCSHFLFLYSEHFSCEFHLNSILEMLRLAPEARIFPLITLAARPCNHLQSVMLQLQQLGYQVSLEPVQYEFIRGGDKMLVVKRLL